MTISDVPSVCFVAMKSPMTVLFLECLESKDNWGITAVLDSISKKIPDLTRRVLFSIEVSISDPVPASEWQLAGIRHFSCPIPRD
jgi:hypothetical protein